MRRRDFTVGLLLASATGVRAQEPATQHRIAIITLAAPVTGISDTGTHARQAFFEELRRAGDIEGQNLTIERYSGEGRPAGYADLAREVVVRKPEVIVASNDAIAKAARAATDAIPIVGIGGDPVQAGLLSYGPIYSDNFERAAVLVDKILRGAKPADLPVEQPTKFELVVNLKTASVLGLTIPSPILARADEVIE